MTRRRPVRRAGLLLVLPLLALLGPATASQAGTPAGTTAGSATAVGALTSATTVDPVQIDLNRLEPRTLTAKDTLTLGGTVRLTGDQALERVQIRVGVGDRIFSRNGLTAADQGIDDDPVRIVQVKDPNRNQALAVGQTSTYAVQVPVADLRLGRLGVYPLRLQVTAVRGGVREVVGQLRTYLPWFPDGPSAPIAVSVLVPMAETPTRGAGGQLLDDRLVQDVAEGGRLDRLLTALEQDTVAPLPGPSGSPSPSPSGSGAAAQPTPSGRPTSTGQGAPTAEPTPGPGNQSPGVSVTPTTTPPGPGTAPSATVVVDADLLTTLEGLANRTLTPAPVPDPQPADEVDAVEVARSFLDRLAALTTDRTVVVLPYADADVDALVADGRVQDVVAAAAAARAAADRLLPAADRRYDTAWPWDGVLSGKGLATLTNVGVRSVVLREGEVNRGTTINYTPGARVAAVTAAGVGVTLLLADTGLTDLVAREDRGAGALPADADPDLVQLVAGERRSPRLAEQRFLAETALITAERPLQRTVLVMPPRHWDPDPAYVRAVLADTGDVPWLTAATLQDAQTSDVTAQGVRTLTLTPEQESARLSSRYLRRVDAARQRLQQVRGALSKPAVLDAAAAALGRATSASFRDDRQAATDLLDSVVAQADAVVAGIRITSLGRVTLTGQTGQIPVTVSNNLHQAVTVRLVARSASPERLKITGPEQVTIAPGTRLQLRLDATVKVRGSVPVTLELQTPDGTPVGPTTELTVTATAFGRVALGVTLAAGALLMVLVGLRLVRRAVRAARGEDADPGADPDAEPGAGSDPDSDPTAGPEPDSDPTAGPEPDEPGAGADPRARPPDGPAEVSR